MKPVQCACCDQPDPTGVGVCSVCAGSAESLVFIRAAGDARARWNVSERLISWLDLPPAQRSLGDVLKGRQALVAVAGTHAQAAVRALGELEVNARVVQRAQWYRALPPAFLFMMVAVIVTGMFAGARAVPFLTWGTLLVAATLLYGARDYLLRPAITLPAGESALPHSARRAAAAALAQLEPGDARDALLDLVRVAEQTYAALPAAFQQSDLGSLVIDITETAGPLALEAERLRNVATELHNSDAPADDSSAVAASAQARLELLHQAVATLASVTRHSTDPEVADNIRKLLSEVRAATAHRAEAETRVEALLKRLNQT